MTISAPFSKPKKWPPIRYTHHQPGNHYGQLTLLARGARGGLRGIFECLCGNVVEFSIDQVCYNRAKYNCDEPTKRGLPPPDKQDALQQAAHIFLETKRQKEALLKKEIEGFLPLKRNS